jgi:predicted TIM-barrel fold metal-dependent hydrolase
MVGDPEAMLAGNRFIHELVQRAPGRLYGSCTINPNFLDESLRVMDICFGEWGFVQLGEMLQYMMNYRMDSDGVERAVRRAIDYDVPVQVHLGTYWHKDFEGSCDGMDHMRDLLRLVDRVPEAKYVLAHAVGCGPGSEYISWADMFLDTIAGLFPTYPDNFWIEIRDFQCPALRRTLAEVPTTRLLSGTDWTTRIGPPFQDYGTMFGVAAEDNPFPARVASFVDFLRQAGATENDVSRIGFDNACDLYRITS